MGFDEDVTDSHERAMQKAPIFGYFSGEERAEGDTEKRRDDTKGRCGRRGGETQDRRYRGRHRNARGDRDLIDGGKSALLCDARSVPRVKRNRSARPTRIGGFAKGARYENQKSDDLRRRSRHS